MITAGIDMGAKTIKVVILENGRILSQSMVLAGFDTAASALQAWEEALREAGLTAADIVQVTATGAGRKTVPFTHGEITEMGADARGAIHLFPTARTVIDVGAEEGRGIKCDAGGKVLDFTVNEKCAAGAGAFTEAMARALEIPLEEMGPLSLRSQQRIPMNAQCAVFAESEVVSLVHAQTPKEDIARAIHDAIASRISSMVRKVGFEQEVVLIGGLAHNAGFLEALKRDMEMEIRVPQEPEFVGALGAALHAREVHQAA